MSATTTKEGHRNGTYDPFTPSWVNAVLNFSSHPLVGERAYVTIDADSSSGARQMNYELSSQEVRIENLRGKEDSVTSPNTQVVRD
jgi:hypothetical protein